MATRAGLGLGMPSAVVEAAKDAQLERIRRGFTEEQAALAAGLARTTAYSHQQWCEVLTIIGDRPDRDELARIIGETAAINRWTIESVARLMIGDENMPGLLARLRNA